MKKTFVKFIAAAAVVGIVFTAGVSMARKKDPIFEMRRTLFMSFGQHNITLEAPVGMCFLDESQYLEGMMVKQVRSMTGTPSSGQLMAMFADCDELAKFIRMPELMAEENDIGGQEPPKADFTYKGYISWLKPKLGRAPMDLQEYLDMREPDFRDNFIDNIKASHKMTGGRQDFQLGDGIKGSLIAPSPDKYNVNEKPHRSKTGLSLAYSVEFEAEYQKHRQAGVIGTTLLRKFPVQVNLVSSATGKNKGRPLERIQNTFDTLVEQITRLNP